MFDIVDLDIFYKHCCYLFFFGGGHRCRIVHKPKRRRASCLVLKCHVIVKMADEREPPPFGEDENQKDEDDLFAEASEVCLENAFSESFDLG